MVRSDRGRVIRWAARTRRRHTAAGALLRTAAPVLPRRPAPRRPLFVIGAPRSGTTMLLAMLDRSPALASLGMGSHFLWELYHPFGARPGTSHAVGPGAITDRERRALDWAIDRIAGDMRYLDKYPRMCLRVGYLHALYPDASFVNIVRDGRAVTSSLITGWRTKGKFGQGTAIPGLSIEGYDGHVWKFLVPPGWEDYVQGRTLAEVCAFQWSAANRAVLEARGAVPAERWHELRYEELVVDPVPTVTRLLDGLDLPPDGVVEYAAGLAGHVSRTAVTAPRPDKWREENGTEVESVLGQLEPTMRRLGYLPAGA
jgi:hypothetical protein